MAAVPPPTGWFPDPNSGGRLRYWDGARWLDVPPPPPPQPAVPPPPYSASAPPYAEGVSGIAAAGYIFAVLFPIIGIVIGIVLIAKNAAGHGVGVIFLSIVVAIVAAMLLGA